MDISVIIPLKDEAESLPELCSWIENVMHQHQYTYEVILVDDGSRDNSWNVIENLNKNNDRIKFHCYKIKL